ncbi:hypothetical protein, partial [Salmonella sp. s51884]|uniref:hypothetical protein n=1 Tax=Salmonella sp. s51884 TaxID=3159654 RepID=UPI003980E590
MVKPGVYTINKKQLKDGDKTTEYVHVEVQPLPQKYDTTTRQRKGCTGMRVLGILMFILVIIGIAVGVAYAFSWEDGNHDDERQGVHGEEGHPDGHVRPSEPPSRTRHPGIDPVQTRPPLIGRPGDGHDDHGDDDNTDDTS